MKNGYNEGTSQRRNGKYKKMGSIEQISTISEMKNSLSKVNKRSKNVAWSLNKLERSIKII